MPLKNSDPESSAVGRWFAPQQMERRYKCCLQNRITGAAVGKRDTDMHMDKGMAQPASEAHFIVSNTKKVLISSKDFTV